MVDINTRERVRKAYRRLRLDAGDLTQLEAESGASLAKGRYWKLENGLEDATPEEREALAKLFKCGADEIPSIGSAAA